MGRPAKGWKLRRRGDRPWSVRFTVGGHEVELGTGEHDRDRAAAKAAELYADAVRGARREPRRSPARGASLEKVAAEWLTAIASAIDPETRSTWAVYTSAHWLPRWATLEAISEATAAEYARERLRVVQASTVRKEISALRGLIRWAVELGRLARAPALPSIPKRALGTVNKRARKGPPVEVSPAEVAALLAAIPVRSRDRYPLRARFVFQYETGLRPSGVSLVSCPEHWTPGATELVVTAAIDKARFGRPLPLTPAARRALATAYTGKPGPIFGWRDCRGTLTTAAIKVLGPERGKRWTEHHFRHARLTHWAELPGANLVGVQYLAGHKHLSTTARYIRPSKRAALEVVELSGTVSGTVSGTSASK